MTAPKYRPRVFVSYSHKDRELKEMFDTNLQVLSDQGEIQCWTDGQILPGDHWPDEITEAMNNADLIIFLVSNNFLASSFIRRKEAPMAMMRVNKGKAVIVPVILSKTPGWQKEEWNTLQALPSEVKPVEHPDWGKPENAFADVEEKLRELISLLPERLAKQAKQWENATQGGALGVPPVELPPSSSAQPPVKHWINWIAVAAVLLLGIALGIWVVGGPSETIVSPEVQATPIELAISPELRAWLDDPKVDRTVVEVFAAKENGYYQNGLQKLRSGTESVSGRRIHQLTWEVNEKPVHAYNGICADIVIKGVAGPLSKPISAFLYFNAERAGDPNASANSIKVDPNNTTGSAPSSSSGLDTPPGFSHVNGCGGGLADMWGHPTFSPQFFAGPEGVIPAGSHRIAMELQVENKPVYRGIFHLVAPRLIYAQPRDEWVKDVPFKKLDVAVVPNSVSRPTSDSLQWKMHIKGDTSKLDEPIAFQCHYFANGVEDGTPEQWMADSSKEVRITRSKEIEGLNYSEFAWGNALTDWKDGSFEQPFALHCGPRGKFTAGPYQVALEVQSRGNPVWRGILTLEVPAQ